MRCSDRRRLHWLVVPSTAALALSFPGVLHAQNWVAGVVVQSVTQANPTPTTSDANIGQTGVFDVIQQQGLWNGNAGSARGRVTVTAQATMNAVPNQTFQCDGGRRLVAAEYDFQFQWVGQDPPPDTVNVEAQHLREASLTAHAEGTAMCEAYAGATDPYPANPWTIDVEADSYYRTDLTLNQSYDFAGPEFLELGVDDGIAGNAEFSVMGGHSVEAWIYAEAGTTGNSTADEADGWVETAAD